MITKNFRLNMLANQYSAAIYNHVRYQNGGDWFPMTVKGQRIEVAIIDGSAGIRMLVDSYLLEPMKKEYSSWEDMASSFLTLCMDDNQLSEQGKSFWQSMIKDMSASLANGEANFHA